MHQTSDEELAVRVQKGRMEALGTLYERHAPNLLAFFRSRLRDEHRAADVHSELWLRVGRRMHQFKGGKFRAWLFTCARHLLLDLYRAPTLRLFAGDDEAASVPAREEADPDQDDQVLKLRSCLGKLTQHEPVAAFVVTRRMTGANYPSICAAFQEAHPGKALEENRAYKIYFDARRWLKECIEAAVS
jgi:RNA polymerase sigma factor (sigma-70 family)